jgi:Glyoxalase/Bleomycin resistance protein/Dioxygenase superfamily
MNIRTQPHGPINQNAFVVARLDEGIAFWTRTMRVGPFFKFPKIEYARSDYRGRPQPIEAAVAIAYSGELMIELIEPQGASIFQEFLDKGCTGLHHIAVLADDMRLAGVDLESRGARRVQGGCVKEGSCVAYFEVPGLEPVLEVACLKPDVLALFEIVKKAGAEWDGTTPTLNL